MKKPKQILQSLFFLLIITVLFSPSGRTQSISGDWYGLAEVQGMALRLNLHISDENGTFKGTFDSPDQGAFSIPLTSIVIEGQHFTFTFAPGGINYQGTTDPGYTFILGKFQQGGQEFLLPFYRNPVELPEDSPQKIMEIYDKQEVYIEMRDGVKLFTSIYSPKTMTEPAPMILFRSPYNSEPGGPNQYNQLVGIYYRYIKEGYILVFQDVRGRFMSYGEFVNVRPFNPDKKGKEIDEASDTYDTAEWLIKNVKGNNGRIGVTGTSYPGFYATMAALAEHPAIKAVSPQAPVTNWFLGDDWHHNGAFFLIDGFSFYTFFGDPMPVPTRFNRGMIPWGEQDSYEFFMRLGPIKNTKAYFPDSIQYWHDMMAHPNYDDFWKATDPRPHLTNIRPAMMTVGGWFDAEDLWGTLATYKAVEQQNTSSLSNTLVMGPWSHGQWAMKSAENVGDVYWGSNTNPYFHQLEQAFFDYHLRDKGDGNLPEAAIFVTGANEWQPFDAWPPTQAKEQTLWFQPNQLLSFSKPAANNSFDEYISDPMKPVPYREDVHLRRDPSYMTDDQRFAARRPDVLVYQTDVLENPVTLTGPMAVDLYVSTTGTDADFIVKLIDVFPDNTQAPAGKEVNVPHGGYQMLVRGEVMRGRFRNSFENPEPFTPGEITQVKFQLPDVAHQFKKGHRIMIQVQSTWFPLVDRNPQTFVDPFTCDESDFQKATVRIYHDKRNPSGVKVLLLKE